MVAEDGVWLCNGRTYPHILPRDKYQLNILPSFRDEFWSWFAKQHIQLQRDFHHLNSSQALCFNLFFPMMNGDEGEFAALLSSLKIEGLPGSGASFEFQPDPAEGTCIDFSLPLTVGSRINFEIKYTESDFGSAIEDESHVKKFESVYKSRLAGRFDEAFCRATHFLTHYQIARNVWHLNETAGDIAVFLFPRANSRLKQEESVITSCAVEPFRSRIRIVYLEDLVDSLEDMLEPNASARRQSLKEFRLKYLPWTNR